MAENPRIEELRRRVQADPASIAFAALAEEFRRVGRNEDAIETCRTGLQRHPAYLSARVTLGRALIETGEYDAAREELETVLRSAPENLAAIRGLATINERLGHSTEMDPHLADLMNTHHAESMRVAAVKPPPPPEPAVVPVPLAVPDPVAVELAAPEGPEWQFALAPDPEPQPQEQAQPAFAAAAWNEAPPQTEPELDLSLSLPLGVAPTPDPDLAMMLEAEPEPEAEPDQDVEFDAGVLATSGAADAEMLATLARLERFLGAIQSLRA